MKQLSAMSIDDILERIISMEIKIIFYDRVASGGVILFDDYGWDAYIDTRRIIDEFFKDKPGILFEFPTGQAIYFKNN